MLRYGKPVAEKLEEQVKQWVIKYNLTGKYVAVIMIWADHPWAAYVSSKQKFAERVGLSVKIFGNEDKELTEVDIYKIIHLCNQDSECVGIMVQLPLPIYLQKYESKIKNAIAWYKDFDGLSSHMISIVPEHSDLFTPATPRAVVSIIDHYWYELAWKKIAMVWYSDLIGKPLSYVLKNKWADISIFTIESNQDEMKKFCRDEADMIISATWKIHLVDSTFIREDKSQVVIDVGRGYKDGKAVGDVDWQEIENNVSAVTPVPGGVWPVTVGALFANIITLHENAEKLSALFE